jgi:AcrR family transcriptional regulator
MGRRRVELDPDAVAEAVAELFAEGGVDNVSVKGTAEKLSVSRATLYRLVPTKDDLLAILFERSTRELLESATAVMLSGEDARGQLQALIRIHIDAAIRMQRYMAVFFDGAGLSPDAFRRWQQTSRYYEGVWQQVISAAMDEGVLQRDDPVRATRLVLGMCIWVSRWYRPSEGLSATQIADSAIQLIAP